MRACVRVKSKMITPATSSPPDFIFPLYQSIFRLRFVPRNKAALDLERRSGVSSTSTAYTCLGRQSQSENEGEIHIPRRPVAPGLSYLAGAHDGRSIMSGWAVAC